VDNNTPNNIIGTIEIGQGGFFRTVTYHYVGRVKAVTPDAVILDQCSWVADSRRFGEAIVNGLTSEAEVEFIGDGIAVFQGGLIDAIPYKHELPTKSR
jgi:hypothetical protein